MRRSSASASTPTACAAARAERPTLPTLPARTSPPTSPTALPPPMRPMRQCFRWRARAQAPSPPLAQKDNVSDGRSRRRADGFGQRLRGERTACGRARFRLRSSARRWTAPLRARRPHRAVVVAAAPSPRWTMCPRLTTHPSRFLPRTRCHDGRQRQSPPAAGAQPETG